MRHSTILTDRLSETNALMTELRGDMEEMRETLGKVEQKVYGSNLIATRLETFVVDKMEHTDKVVIMLVGMLVILIFLLLFICLFFLAFLLQKNN